jgi:hypothetical protein
MNLIKITGHPVTGNPVEVIVGKVGNRELRSNRHLREFLELQAINHFGGREGRDWRIVQNPVGCLIPVYVREIRTGDCLEVR